MGERQAKIIEADIAEIFDEDSEGENLCCTIEAGTAVYVNSGVSITVSGSGRLVAEVPVSVHELRPARTSIARRVPRTLLGLAKYRMALGSAR